MEIHAIQTGVVTVKPTFYDGSAEIGIPRALWHLSRETPHVNLPIFCWVIDHPEGIVVVDTGERAGVVSSFFAESNLSPDETLAAKLSALGISQDDIHAVVLTHLHTDHLGGIETVRGRKILASAYDVAVLNNPLRRRFSSLVNPIPDWLHAEPIRFTDQAFGAFRRSAFLTRAQDVIAVPTPGHTEGHLSIFVVEGDTHVLLAGDVTYSVEDLDEKKIRGITMNLAAHRASIDMIRAHAAMHPLVYLPSHDPESATRLKARAIIEVTS